LPEENPVHHKKAKNEKSKNSTKSSHHNFLRIIWRRKWVGSIQTTQPCVLSGIFAYNTAHEFYQILLLITEQWTTRVSELKINRSFSLGQFGFPLQITRYSLENCSFIQLKIIYYYAHGYLKIWQQEFSRVSSHGMKWGNKPPSRKRSIRIYKRKPFPVVNSISYHRPS